MKESRTPYPGILAPLIVIPIQLSEANPMHYIGIPKIMMMVFIQLQFDLTI